MAFAVVLLLRDPSIQVADAEMDETMVRLDEVADRFRMVLLDSPPNTPASVSDCHVDSGDLFQPAAAIGWTPPRSDQQEVHRQLARALERTGWSVSEETRFDHEVSYTSPDGWTASGSIVSFEDHPRADPYVGVEVRIDGAEPCTTG